MTEPTVDQAAAAERLHARLLELLNDPDDRWHEQPTIAAGVLAAVLTDALRQIATVAPGRLPWIRSLLVSMADHVAGAVTPPAAIRAQAGKSH